MRMFLLAMIWTAAAVWSCTPVEKPGAARRAYNLITLSEIQKSSAATAYDLIYELRPNWLRGRGEKSIKYSGTAYPVVYINGNRFGPIEALRGIPRDNITEIEYLNSGEASLRLGMNHPSGAILVTVFR